MAATRKLQGEIDRCLKKVSEGVETFEDIWQKVHNATNSNQKEKYEADLKKEIKKLQRLRDQIKSWIASGEIKDKSTLLDYRKLIETQMERFKVVERETKTKAYSKEGLGAAQKLDPAQKEREEIANWLVSSIDALNLQIDLFESEIELLLAGKKKRLDKDKQDRMEELKSKLEKHRFHIRKLETLLRMLDNMSVEVNQIRRIKDDVEYYIESSQDPDFEENEYIYDDIIGLDDVVDLSGVGLPSSATTDSNETGGSPTSITSGTSPLPSSSPPHSVPLHNHSSDSSNECADKKKKEDIPKVFSSDNIELLDQNEMTMMNHFLQPVKPTAVRATANNLNNSTNSILNSSTTQASLNSSMGSTPGTKAPMLVSSTPSKPIVSSTIIQPPIGAPAQVSCQSTVVSNNQPLASNSITTSSCSSNQSSQSSGGTSSGGSSASPAVTNHMGTGNFAAVAAANAHNNTNSKHNTNNSINSSSNNSTSGHTSENGPIALSHVSSAPPTQQLQQLNNINNTLHHNNTSVNVPGSNPQQQAVHHHPTQLHSSSIVLQNNQQQLNSTTTNSQLQLSSKASINSIDHITHNNCASPPSSVSSRASPLPSIGNTTPSPAQPLMNGPISNKIPEGMSSLKSIAQQVIDRAGLELPTNDSSSRSLFESSNKPPSGVMSEALIPPLLGVAPLGAVPLQKEHQCQFQMMEASFYHMPQPSDSERLRSYLPRNQYPTPPYYSQTQLPHSDTVEFYQRLSTETLFFVFYYMEGTKAQYLAAKALKKQSWRFHTKYMMWFQRHEEPKVINEEYEQGTYIYFDYEKWGQRKKEGFTFEYKYLEDRDLN